MAAFYLFKNFTNFKSIYHLNLECSNYLLMKMPLNSKFIVLLFFTQLLFSCKNNISAGVGSDGKSLDSTVTNTDTTTVPIKNSKELKE